MELEGLRREIDRIDADMVHSFCKRMEVSAEIAVYKMQQGLPVRDAGREAVVLDKVERLAGEPFGKHARTVYSAVMEASRAYQHAQMAGTHALGSVRRRYGLVGRKLGHSHSPLLHRLLAPYAYECFELEPEALEDFLRQPDIGGLNVTIPYKETVMRYCDEIDPLARRIGSVNTLVYDARGRITGHNTDYAGFLRMAAGAGIAFGGRKVVVLGSGGTSRTVRQAVWDQGAAEVITVSRSGADNYENLSRHADADILINTTPVGMMPDGGEAPVSLEMFASLSGVLDVIYNPLRTRLVLQAQRLRIPAAGGLAMLAYQAAEAASLFLGEAVPESRARAALDSLRAQVENVVLIGMPGCGKSVVGRAMAELLGRPLLDTDELIEARLGMPVPQIFAEQGEAAFREVERAVIAEAAGRSGVIIATGGGSVLREENCEALARNGRFVFLKRQLGLLSTQGRPLSVDVRKLAEQRLPIYHALADIIIENDATVDAAARRVWEAFRQ